MTQGMTKLIEHLQQELSGVAIASQESGLTKEEKSHFKSVGKVLHDTIKIALEFSSQELRIGQYVYHKEIYQGKEVMEVVGIRKTEVELQGDYSGGTHHPCCLSSWMPIEGLLFSKNNNPWIYTHQYEKS